MEKVIDLTTDILATITTNFKLRNAIAEAYWSKDKGERIQKANVWPLTYRVTEEQIEIAKAQREKDKANIIAANVNNIVFTGMGMTFNPIIEDCANNYRFRTSFKNKTGREFFVEFTTSGLGQMRMPHAEDWDLKRLYESIPGVNKSYTNYKGLEHRDYGNSRLKSILHIINHEFDCAFEAVVIDNYTIGVGDCLNVSPK